jgi:hypothetical protein
MSPRGTKQKHNFTKVRDVSPGDVLRLMRERGA